MSLNNAFVITTNLRSFSIIAVVFNFWGIIQTCSIQDNCLFIIILGNPADCYLIGQCTYVHV